ncbi:Uncharacterised protein [Mycobacteroides abscessus subsp. abscessus]|nr:Uncharacterised protein [Mycobacteroides abscessus subsp. abscessus]
MIGIRMVVTIVAMVTALSVTVLEKPSWVVA